MAENALKVIQTVIITKKMVGITKTIVLPMRPEITKGKRLATYKS
jgi:hypothetical protein